MNHEQNNILRENGTEKRGPVYKPELTQNQLGILKALDEGTLKVKALTKGSMFRSIGFGKR